MHFLNIDWIQDEFLTHQERSIGLRYHIKMDKYLCTFQMLYTFVWLEVENFSENGGPLSNGMRGAHGTSLTANLKLKWTLFFLTSTWREIWGIQVERREKITLDNERLRGIFDFLSINQKLPCTCASTYCREHCEHFWCVLCYFLVGLNWEFVTLGSWLISPFLSTPINPQPLERVIHVRNQPMHCMHMRAIKLSIEISQLNGLRFKSKQIHRDRDLIGCYALIDHLKTFLFTFSIRG